MRSLLTVFAVVGLVLAASGAAEAAGITCMVDPTYTGGQGAESGGMQWYTTMADMGSWGPGGDAIVYLAAGEHMGKTMPVGKVYDCAYLWGATNVQIIGAGADKTVVWGQLSNIGTGTTVTGVTFKGNLNDQATPQNYRIVQGMFFDSGAGAVTFDHVIFDGFDYDIAGLPDGSTIDHCDFINEDFWDNYKTFRAVTCDDNATVTNSIFQSPWYVLSGLNESSPTEVRNNAFRSGNYGIPSNNGSNITGNLYYTKDAPLLVNADYTLPEGSPLWTAGTDGGYVGAIPEPATLALMALGGIGMLLRRKRMK